MNTSETHAGRLLAGTLAIAATGLVALLATGSVLGLLRRLTPTNQASSILTLAGQALATAGGLAGLAAACWAAVEVASLAGRATWQAIRR